MTSTEATAWTSDSNVVSKVGGGLEGSMVLVFTGGLRLGTETYAGSYDRSATSTSAVTNVLTTGGGSLSLSGSGFGTRRCENGQQFVSECFHVVNIISIGIVELAGSGGRPRRPRPGHPTRLLSAAWEGGLKAASCCPYHLVCAWVRRRTGRRTILAGYRVCLGRMLGGAGA